MERSFWLVLRHCSQQSYTALQHIQGLSFRPEVCSSSEHESTENSFAFKKRIMKHVVCGCIIVCLSPYTSSPHITSELNPASLLRQDSISFNGNGFLSFLSNNDWGLLVWFLQQRVTGHGTLYLWSITVPVLQSHNLVKEKWGERDFTSPVLKISAVQSCQLRVKLTATCLMEQQESGTSGLGLAAGNDICRQDVLLSLQPSVLRWP